MTTRIKLSGTNAVGMPFEAAMNPLQDWFIEFEESPKPSQGFRVPFFRIALAIAGIISVIATLLISL